MPYLKLLNTRRHLTLGPGAPKTGSRDASIARGRAATGRLPIGGAENPEIPVSVRTGITSDIELIEYQQSNEHCAPAEERRVNTASSIDMPRLTVGCRNEFSS